MKVVCFSDLHIGQKNYCKVDPVTGLYQREKNAINILNQIVDTCINEQIDVCIFAGDMFKNNLPNPTLIDKVNEAFIRLSQHNVYTLVLDGNHDVSKQDSFCSGLHQFESLQVSNIIQTRFFKVVLKTFQGITYQFVFLPTHHKKEDIINCIQHISKDYPTIVIGHLTIKNAFLNDWNIISDDDCIDLDVFNQKQILAVVLGHLHKYQVLSEQPKVFYCGSCDRIDFSEEKQDKGYIYMEISDKIDVFEYRKLNVQKFITVKVDCSNESESNEVRDMIISKLPKRGLKDAILRIKVKLSNKMKIDEKDIIQYAYDKKVQYLLKIQYDIPNVQNDIVINNFLPIQDVVKQYFKGKPREKECSEIAYNIIKEVEEC